VSFEVGGAEEEEIMKYVFGMFDDPSSAADATRRVEGHARVRRIGTADNLHAFGLGTIEEKHFSDGLRRGEIILCAEVDDGKANLVADEFKLTPTTTGTTAGGGIAAKARELKAEAKEKVEELKEKVTERKAERAETRAARLAEERSIPLINETLAIGKREVDRGAVRVLTHVVTQPVDESVWLHEEEIEVERRPIHRAVRTGEALTDQSVELRARGEEAVVAKSAEVVEEVVVRKRDYEREAKVHESLKHTEVEIQKDKPRTSRPSTESRPSLR
jgi:uncharacterized protein (TIGR02271 family)